jgi:tyrosyl-tRNA synthetase
MKTLKVNKTMEDEIDELLTRGVSAIFPSKEELKKLLMSGKKLTVFLGADPTGSDLHLGHSKNFILLEKFRKLGHKTIVLFGDFTAMLGDPTDKSAARVPLTTKEVANNMKTWKKQLSPIVNFSTFKNGSRIVKNGTWLSKLSFSDVVKLASCFTVQQMIERDMFQKRIEEKKPLFLHEFMYPLMQGYDSVVLNADIEIGGNDQTFNMLAGRTLVKQYKNKEKFVIANTLIVDEKTGKKMSKSEGNYIGLSESPVNMFGKVMATGDGLILPLLQDCTTVSLEAVKSIKESLEKGENPKVYKETLAYELVKMYHGEKEAERAKDFFNKTFSQNQVPENIKEVPSKEGMLLSDVFLQEGIVSSKAEFTRLVKEQAITNLTTNEKVLNIKHLSISGVYKVGKHRFLRIK